MRFRPAVPVSILLVLVPTTACVSAPPYQGMTPNEMYELGLERYERGDWDKTIEVLDRLLLSPQGAAIPQAAQARLMLAWSFFNDERYLSAQDEFTRFINRFPLHPEAPQAALTICRSFVALAPGPELDATYVEEAAIRCRQVAIDYSGREDEVSQEALRLSSEMRSRLAEKDYKAGVHYQGRGRPLSSIPHFTYVFEQYGDTDWAPKALLRLVEIYRSIGYDIEAEEWRTTLLSAYPESPEAKSVAGDGTASSEAGG